MVFAKAKVKPANKESQNIVDQPAAESRLSRSAMSFAGVMLIGDGKPPPASTSAITVADCGYLLLVVDGYSRIKEDTPNGEYVESRCFTVGGYRWRVRYYPNGMCREHADCISLGLFLDSDVAAETVKVQFEFSFVDKVQKLVPSYIHGTKVHSYNDKSRCWVYGSFMKREALEKTAHLKGDSFTIKCDIVIVKDVSTRAATAPIVVVPASDMHQHLTGLLQSGEGTDVTFDVGGDIFVAHRVVLASRSKVFKAEISDLTKNGKAAGVISINDMDAGVFAALLFFIYSDSVPEIDEQEDDVMWQKLLVAAQKYDLLRLKLMCEQKLCTYITTSNVATILALAEQHHCQGLKKACLDFLYSPSNLQEVMVLGGLDHLISSCPIVMKELVAKLVSPKIDANSEQPSATAVPFVVVPASDMHLDFTSLLISGDATDVVFQVGSETFNAHRCVLAARSAVFRAELFGPMKEGTTNSVIQIEDMEVKVFKLLLRFIYSDSVPKMWQGDDDIEDSDVDHVMWQYLLVAADRYDLQRLKLICEDKLCGYINHSTVATILALAEKHHCRGLKESCFEFLDSTGNLQEVMAVGGLDFLKSSSPSLLIDLISKLASLNVDN